MLASLSRSSSLAVSDSSGKEIMLGVSIERTVVMAAFAECRHVGKGWIHSREQHGGRRGRVLKR